jgi:hypothetical protein
MVRRSSTTCHADFATLRLVLDFSFCILSWHVLVFPQARKVVAVEVLSGHEC